MYKVKASKAAKFEIIVQKITENDDAWLGMAT